MAYDDLGDGIDAATLKAIFTSELKFEVDRIEREQLGSGVPGHMYLNISRIDGEFWRILARENPTFTPEDDRRLEAAGWQAEDRQWLSEFCEELADVDTTSTAVEHYSARFNVRPTPDDAKRIERMVCLARAHACDAIVEKLQLHPSGIADWVKEAMQDPSPFRPEARPIFLADPLSGPIVSSCMAGSASDPIQAANEEFAPEKLQAGTGTLLMEAAEKCIRTHIRQGALAKNTVKQIRTAIRLFDYACGEGITIEELTQAHVDQFYDLCRALPNRWGRTKAEIAGGLSASLKYAQELRDRGEQHRVGIEHATINKHISHISKVLDFMDDDGSLTGIRPAVPLRLKPKNQQIGAKKIARTVRARDKRANWNRQEIARLLEAPPFHGCAGIDERFVEGEQVIHDAWYWLPLMFILYGGRSAELTGLPLGDVHEDDAIPYFQVNYSDLRALKNAQSIRKLPIHPELIRLGFLEYVAAMRKLGHGLLFPEMHSPNQSSFAKTFYTSVFRRWRSWAFPNGTEWSHVARGATKDKDVHSFRGVASSLMKGKIPDSVRFDILGHEGENTTQRVYDEEAELDEKLMGLVFISPLTAHLAPFPLNLRPTARQKFGARRGRPKKS